MTPISDSDPADPVPTSDPEPAPEPAPESLTLEQVITVLGIVILVFFLCLLSFICMMFLPFLILLLFIPASIVMVAWIVLSLTLGREYLQYLRGLGYTWPEVSDANLLLLKCGRKAYTLPPAADYEILPKSRNTTAGLITFIKRLERYKKKVRRRQLRRNQV